ncbi:MAG: [LysW]-lysine hydrolase [Phycisphaeraceae bacterium]|nr:MAG: [LysW]-lysine hydrolase [Phycisphaeraceae bacterium]
MSTATVPRQSLQTTPATDEQATDLLVDLVATPSVSGHEQRAVEVFAHHAAALGYRAEIDAAGNGLAWRRGSADDKLIVLLGHIDTVPGDIPVRLKNGILHGRGSVDAKGPLCAFLAAASRAELPEGVSLLVAAALGEEAESPGAHHLATQLRPDACFIGEPSGWDGVTLGYKGSVRMRATVTRDNGHSAAPGDSACDYLFGWWRRVEARMGELNEGRTGEFDRIAWSVRGISSENDGLHDVGELMAGYRLPTWIAPEELRVKLRQIDHEGVKLRFVGDERAWRSERNDAVARALTGAIRGEGGRPHPKVKTGTADMNVVGPVWGCPIAAYGPGDSMLDHAPNEHQKIDEYLRSIRVLTRAIESLAQEIR